MEKYKIIPDGIKDIEFTKRPDPVPYNYRISYKVAQICLILDLAVTKGGCSFQMIQIVATALTSDFDMVQLKLFIDGKMPDYSIIKYDPAVNYALQYALAERLIIQQNNGKLKLTESGKNFCKLIMEDNTLLIEEKKSLTALCGKITENALQDLRKKWGELNAYN